LSLDSKCLNFLPLLPFSWQEPDTSKSSLLMKTGLPKRFTAETEEWARRSAEAVARIKLRKKTAAEKPNMGESSPETAPILGFPLPTYPRHLNDQFIKSQSTDYSALCLENGQNERKFDGRERGEEHQYGPY
jgi:hypothetical protein